MHENIQIHNIHHIRKNFHYQSNLEIIIAI